MSSDLCHLSDLANIQGGYAFKSADFGSEGVAVIKIANIQPPVVLLEGVDRVAPEKLLGLERFKLQDGDILMAMTGATVGKVGRFKEIESAYLNQRVARISSKNGKQFDDFIYAVVSQPRFDELIEGASAGSAQANISASGIGSVEIPRLTETEQLGIGSIARALDDRITLLRETNTTLEAIAQALFKSWFVDFDPVHAKMQGRAPEGMDEATAALFPDSFEESELGPVPKGWRSLQIGDACKLGRGASPRPIQNFMGGDVPWIKIADATASDGLFIFETKEKVTREGALKSVAVKPGDLIMSNSASCGIPSFVEIDGCIHDGWLHFSKFQKTSKYLLFFWLRHISSHLVQIADGSVQKNLNIALVSAQQIIQPTQNLLLVFDDLVSPFLKRARDNCLQIQTLSELRDTILPRLISGQHQLPEVG